MGLAHCEWILDRAYLLSIVATTVTLALCGIFHKQFDRLLGSALARYLFPIGMAVCTLLVLGARNEGTVGTALVTAYGIGTGVFSALFLMNFGAVLGDCRSSNRPRPSPSGTWHPPCCSSPSCSLGASNPCCSAPA